MILREIAYQRSGDKGDNVGVALFPHEGIDIEKISKNITAERLKQHLEKYNYSDVVIRVYDHLNLVQIVFSNILEGGVSVNKKMDRNGKALGDVILEMKID